MALINRMSRLFTADVHAVLDRIEEPDVLLKHAVREMEEELARSELQVRALEHEHGMLGERQRKTHAVLAELGEQLDVCFASGNDELARKVLKRRLETERLERHVAERRATLDKELGGAARGARRAARAARRHAAKSRAADGNRRAATIGARRSSSSATPKSKSLSCANGRRGSGHERRADQTVARRRPRRRVRLQCLRRRVARGVVAVAWARNGSARRGRAARVSPTRLT